LGKNSQILTNFIMDMKITEQLTDHVPLTFDLSTPKPNHITSRISQGHFLYQVRTLWKNSLFRFSLQTNKHYKLDRPTQADR